MTEEQIRAIVRDEIQMEAGREGGILDEARQHSFAMMRGIIEQLAKNAIKQFGPDPAKSPLSDDAEIGSGPDGRGH